MHVFLVDVRLTGGRGPHEGLVEIYHKGVWGMVCDNKWDIADAEVVCRQLGFPGAKSAHCCSNFGAGPSKIWLDNVKCSSSNTRLGYCNHHGWGVHDCGLGQSAGAVCQRKYVCNAAVYKYSGKLI